MTEALEVHESFSQLAKVFEPLNSRGWGKCTPLRPLQVMPGGKCIEGRLKRPCEFSEAMFVKVW